MLLQTGAHTSWVLGANNRTDIKYLPVDRNRYIHGNSNIRDGFALADRNWFGPRLVQIVPSIETQRIVVHS
jgi:hypothetical protein